MPKTGASSAARAQERAQRESISLSKETRDQQLELLAPFLEAGTETGLPGLIGLSTPEGQAGFYEDYYDSPQYQAQAGQARNQQLAASEATGGLGATSTQNQLARIAPTLGLQALGQQQSLYGDLTNLGYGAAGSSAGFYGQSAQSQYGALQNIGNIQAAKSKAPLQHCCKWLKSHQDLYQAAAAAECQPVAAYNQPAPPVLEVVAMVLVMVSGKPCQVIFK